MIYPYLIILKIKNGGFFKKLLKKISLDIIEILKGRKQAVTLLFTEQKEK